MLKVFIRCIGDHRKETFLNVTEVLKKNLPIVNDEGKILENVKEKIEFILTDRHYAAFMDARLFLTAILLIEHFGYEYFSYAMSFILEHTEFPFPGGYESFWWDA